MYDIEHLLMCLFATCMQFSVGMSIQIVCPWFGFLLLSFKSSLYILDSRPLLNVLCKYFLPVCGLSFHSLNSVLHRGNVLNFNEIQLRNFFIDHVLMYLKLITKPVVTDIFSYLSSRNYIVLHFYIYSQFWINFVKSVRSMARWWWWWFTCGYPVVPASLFEKTILSPLNYLYSFVKDQLKIFVWVYFWTLYSVLLTCLLFHQDLTVFIKTSLSSSQFYSKSWSQVVSVPWPSSMLYWLLWIFCLSIKLLNQFTDIYKIIFQDFVWGCVGSMNWEKITSWWYWSFLSMNMDSI